MIVDFRRLSGARDFEADICIIGAGAAGITIAREFIGSAKKVILLEAGGFEFEDEVQAFYDGEEAGNVPPRDVLNSRLRFFGGTTNHWAGCCAPFNPIDFMQRPWVPHSGWPIGRAELDPFYARAHEVCELGPFVYDDKLWRGLDIKPLPFDPKLLVTRFFQDSPPTNFGERYRSELEQAENVQVILYANVRGLAATENGGHVSHCDITTRAGKRATVKAKKFVVACGGIENARLLLLSNDVVRGGLGNTRDVVGRYFLDHIFGHLGVVWLESERVPERMGLDETTRHPHRKPENPIFGERDVPIRPLTCLTEEFQTRNQVLNSGVMLELSDDEAGAAVPLERKDGVRLTQAAVILSQSETAPNPNSRVSLAREKDALGLNKVRVEWQLSDIDKLTQLAQAKTYVGELTRLNIVRGRIADWLRTAPDDWSQALGRDTEPLEGSSHHMGTTRMSDDPNVGVVDRDCRVHGIDNLYIAGSSVFPTSGYVNPTLTIVALALRLSDNMKM